MTHVGGRTITALAAAVAFLLVACGSSQREETGQLTMNIMAAADARATIIETAATIAGSSKLVIDGPRGYAKEFTSSTLPWEFSHNPMPVGGYTYVATARIGSKTFESTGAFEIASGKMTKLSVLMQQTNAAPSMVVTAPYIEQVTIEGLNDHGSGGWGVPLELEARVRYPDNDKPDMDHFYAVWTSECLGEKTGDSFFFLPLDYNLFVDVGSGGFFVPKVDVSTTFTSFCQGIERVTLTAVNTNNLLCPEEGCELVSSVSFVIPYHDQGSAGSIDFNYAPAVTCDHVENAEPLPGGTVVLNAVASDPDGPDSALTYKWSDTCDGTFADDTALDTTWVAPDTFETECTLKLEVFDGEGGKNYGTLKLKTAPASVVPLTLQPYIDVCDSTIWACSSVATYAQASSSIVDHALVLSKRAPDGDGVAFGPNARIIGVAGMTLSSASFDAVGSIGGGAPRFLVRTAAGACPLELVDAQVVGSTYTFLPSATCNGVMTGLDIIGDMGGQAGELTITNIKVNGIPVTM